MSTAEREHYTDWWIEESGLSLAELHQIAVGLVALTDDDSETTPRPHQHSI